MRIAVCDDDPVFLDEFSKTLRMFAQVERVILFSDMREFFAELTQNDSFEADIVMLDLDWGSGMSGIDYATRLFRTAPHIPVIYVTGYSDRFSQRILLADTNLLGYLTKPVDAVLLQKYLQKYADRCLSERHLTFSCSRQTISLRLTDIHCIESRNHCVEIHTAQASYTVYEKLSTIVPRLSDAFVQCHKSYVVNMAYIQRLEAAHILLRDGRTVPVSRSMATQTRQKVFAYLGAQA